MTLKSKLTVYESHSDDAFLSLGGHIERWVKEGFQVKIVTVFCDKKRAKEAERYAKAVGASWEGLYYEQGTRPYEAKLMGASLSPDNPSANFYPLGIRHQDHKTLRSCAPLGVRFYLDSPHHAIQTNGVEVNANLWGKTVISFLKPPARKYRHIPIFKSQAKFFYLNTAEKLRQTIEMIVAA